VGALVAELRTGSAEFARLWASHEVYAPAFLRKTLLHPLVSPLIVNCDILDIPDRGQRVVIYTDDPGSSAEEVLGLLSVTGTQKMDVPS
jgi:MmyB-like transcription regulator ligand binding domain